MNPQNREELPTVRITAIWGNRDLSMLPPKSVVQKAAKACGELLAMLGFTHCAFGVGSLESCIKNSHEHDRDLLDPSSFDGAEVIKSVLDKDEEPTPADQLDATNATGEHKAETSKISVEDMLSGIDMTRTHNREDK